MPARRLAVLVACLAGLTALPGCGATGADTRPDRAARLTLDFTPNAVHAGIELAVARDYTGAEGVQLQVEAPSSTADATTLLTTGRTDFAVMDLHDVAIAREKGKDLVAVMALVQDPLASVIAGPGITRPRQLEGRTVGVTGAPSDDAVLDAIVRGDGGDPERVRRARIGFRAVPSLASKRVAAATGFWNAEGVQAKERVQGSRVFRLDASGAPPYPELVLVTTRELIQDDPALVRATVASIQRGYREAIADPQSAVEAVVQANEDNPADRNEIQRELDAVQPAFQAADGTIGTFDTSALRRWAAWEQRVGIVRKRPEVVLMFDGSYARRAAGLTAQEDG